MIKSTIRNSVNAPKKISMPRSTSESPYIIKFPKMGTPSTTVIPTGVPDIASVISAPIIQRVASTNPRAVNTMPKTIK